MLPNGLSSLSFEKPALRFLSFLFNDKFDVISPPVFETDFGIMQFEGVDLLQERGRLPLLVLDFLQGENAVKIFYFGHISPFKLHCFELHNKDSEPEKFIFNGPDAVVSHLSATDLKELFPQNIDYKIVAGSLFLWRSCLGLSKVCESSLRKYFSKMKSVSRYEWKMDSYSSGDGLICEQWSAVVSCIDGTERKINVTLSDGVIVRAK